MRIGPTGSALAGALWVAWPCGLLQSAILVAALAGSPLSGAAMMATFALASGLGLSLAPWLWRRWGSAGGALVSGGSAIRIAGALLAVASGWALTRGVWAQVAAYCGL